MKRLTNHLGIFARDESGGMLILVAFLIVTLMGMTALVIDVGYLYQARRQMVNAADAAALAGAQELIYNRDNHEIVAGVARNYANIHGADPDRIEVLIPNFYTVEVETVTKVDFTFARILGFTDSDVPARAVAVVLPLELGRGVVPWTIPAQEFEWGELVVLKYARHTEGDIGPGNHHAIGLGGSGADQYRDNIKYGSEEEVKVGHWYDTETGNKAGPTRQGVQYRIDSCTCSGGCFDPDEQPKNGCPRFITVPVYGEIRDKPGKTEILVIGFVVFYLEGVAGVGNDSIVTGRFVEALAAGSVGDPYNTDIDFGAYNVRLFE